jgi:hypothetical protein
MSHGPGHVQRTILALIDANPDGAWTTSQLCQHVYGVYHVGKKHSVAVIRALQRTKLPLGWYVNCAPGHEYIVYSKRSVDSTLRVFWLRSHGHLTFEAFKRTAAAKDIVARVEKRNRYRAAGDEMKRLMDRPMSSNPRSIYSFITSDDVPEDDRLRIAAELGVSPREISELLNIKPKAIRR